MIEQFKRGIRLDMDDWLYARAVDLMEADVGDELVALEPNAGNCFGFNEVATVVWRSLSEPKSFDQLRTELLNEYEVSRQQCTEELHDLLNDMVDKGLLTRADGTHSPSGHFA